MSQIVKQTEESLKQKIIQAVKAAAENGELPVSDVADFIIEKPADKKNGDFSSNIAMAGARAYHMAPRAIAEAIVKNLDLKNTFIEKTTEVVQ